MGSEVIYMDLRIKKSYNWLWIKYATGFRSNTHCMACLVGGRSEIIPPRRKNETIHPYAPGTTYRGPLNEHNFKYIYLCGVTDNYSDNLHVVVRFKPGSVVTFADEYCEVTLTNCERVPIHKIPEEDKVDRGYHFTTCRNFQFGYQYLRHTDPYDGMSAEEAGIAPSYGKSKGMAKRAKTYERKNTYSPGTTRIRFVRKR